MAEKEEEEEGRITESLLGGSIPGDWEGYHQIENGVLPDGRSITAVLDEHWNEYMDSGIGEHIYNYRSEFFVYIITLLDSHGIVPLLRPIYSALGVDAELRRRFIKQDGRYKRILHKPHHVLRYLALKQYVKIFAYYIASSESFTEELEEMDAFENGMRFKLNPGERERIELQHEENQLLLFTLYWVHSVRIHQRGRRTLETPTTLGVRQYVNTQMREFPLRRFGAISPEEITWARAKLIRTINLMTHMLTDDILNRYFYWAFREYGSSTTMELPGVGDFKLQEETFDSPPRRSSPRMIRFMRREEWMNAADVALDIIEDALALVNHSDQPDDYEEDELDAIATSLKIADASSAHEAEEMLQEARVIPSGPITKDNLVDLMFEFLHDNPAIHLELMTQILRALDIDPNIESLQRVSEGDIQDEQIHHDNPATEQEVFTAYAILLRMAVVRLLVGSATSGGDNLLIDWMMNRGYVDMMTSGEMKRFIKEITVSDDDTLRVISILRHQQAVSQARKGKRPMPSAVDYEFGANKKDWRKFMSKRAALLRTFANKFTSEYRESQWNEFIRRIASRGSRAMDDEVEEHAAEISDDLWNALETPGTPAAADVAMGLDLELSEAGESKSSRDGDDVDGPGEVALSPVKETPLALLPPEGPGPGPGPGPEEEEEEEEVAASTPVDDGEIEAIDLNILTSSPEILSPVAKPEVAFVVSVSSSSSSPSSTPSPVHALETMHSPKRGEDPQESVSGDRGTDDELFMASPRKVQSPGYRKLSPPDIQPRGVLSVLSGASAHMKKRIIFMIGAENAQNLPVHEAHVLLGIERIASRLFYDVVTKSWASTRLQIVTEAHEERPLLRLVERKFAYIATYLYVLFGILLPRFDSFSRDLVPLGIETHEQFHAFATKQFNAIRETSKKRFAIQLADIMPRLRMYRISQALARATKRNQRRLLEMDIDKIMALSSSVEQVVEDYFTIPVAEIEAKWHSGQLTDPGVDSWVEANEQYIARFPSVDNILAPRYRTEVIRQMMDHAKRERQWDQGGGASPHVAPTTPIVRSRKERGSSKDEA